MFQIGLHGVVVRLYSGAHRGFPKGDAAFSV